VVVVDLEADASVFQAVLDNMIRPEAGRIGPAPPAVVLALDRTVSVCSPVTPVVNHLGCIRNWEVQAFAGTVFPPRAPLFEDVLTPIQRAQLTGAFWRRNQRSHLLPVGALNNATIVAPAEIERRKQRSDAATGVVSFSVPAHGGDGQALVYATYRCGQLCGYGWFVLLEGRQNLWHVVSHRGMWVS